MTLDPKAGTASRQRPARAASYSLPAGSEPTVRASGGQTGVDRAALDAAIVSNVEYGGWCPNGGWAEVDNCYSQVRLIAIWSAEMLVSLSFPGKRYLPVL